jgi:hypothetical protein
VAELISSLRPTGSECDEYAERVPRGARAQWNLESPEAKPDELGMSTV